MKLSISNIAWSLVDDDKILSMMKGLGFDGLEIAPSRIFPEDPYEHLSEAALWKEELKKKYDLEVSSMQSLWFKKQEKLFEDEIQRNELLNYSKKAIDFAHGTGCKNLVFGSPKNRCTYTDSDYAIGIEFWQNLSEYANEKGTVVSIEPNPDIYGTNYINKTKEAFKLVDEVNKDSFKVNLDLGTMIANKEEPAIIKGNVDKINHVHISEPYLKLIEKRQLHNEVISILKSENYDGYISIEMGNQDNLEAVIDTMKYLREII